MKSLVKIRILTFIATMALGTNAFGQSLVPIPTTVPSTAYVSGSLDEVHYYFQQVTYTVNVATAGASTVTLNLPAGVTVADVDGDGANTYADYVACTDNAAATITINTATANTIVLGVTAAVTNGEVINFIFPAAFDSSVAATPKVVYSISTGAADGDDGFESTDSLTFAPTIVAEVGFASALNNSGGGAINGDLKGEYFPARPTAITAVTPTYIDDSQGAGNYDEGANYTDWTGASLDGTTNAEVVFQVWASQTAGLKYVKTGVARELYRYDAGTEVKADNFVQTAAISDAFRIDELEPDVWYYYITSNLTADWALGESDTLVVRHHPVFVTDQVIAGEPNWQLDDAAITADERGRGQGIDYDHDSALDNAVGGADDFNALYIDTGAIIGIDGNFVAAGNSYDNVRIYWHGQDVNDPGATVQVFMSTSSALTAADIETAGGLVTGLAGTTEIEITTSPMLLDDPLNYVLYTISQSPIQAAGTYYFYLVANDGTTQTMQIVTDAAAGGAAPITLTVNIKHSPYFEFQDLYPNAVNTIDTKTTESIKISWGETMLSARDIDATEANPLTIDLYAVIDYLALGNYAAMVSGNPLSDAALLAYPGTILIANIVDTLDGQLDNSYMWDIRSVAPALTAYVGANDEYGLYAVVSQGVDKVVVQYNSDGVPGPGATDDREFRFTHTSYFQAKNPVPNSSIELVGRDNFDLEWDGFDLDAAGALVQIFISPTASAVDHSLTNWGAIAATPGLFWLDVTGALDGSTKPAATDGVLATGGSFTIDVAEYLDDITGDGVGPAAWGPLIAGGNDVGAIGTEYDVWYMIDEDGNNFTNEVPIKAPGTLFFSIEDPGTAQNLRISPNKPLTAAIGDVITLSVELSTGGAGAAITEANFSIDFESDYLSVVNPSAPFTAGATLANAVINSSTLNGTTYELSGGFDGGSVGSAATWYQIATFDVTVTANPAAGSPVHAPIIFVDGGARETRLYDANVLPILTSYDAPAADVFLVRPGRITGNVEVEGRSDDKAQDVSFLLVPRGSMQPISNSGYIAANDDDADATNGVGVSLDANGTYTLSAIPTGNYDLILRKGGYLDQMVTNINITAMVDLAQNFLDGNKLFGGDAAGYDHDNDSGTLDVGDNQIDATDDAPAFTLAMTATPDSTAWNALADITGDSLIWADDWAIMVKNQNRTSEGVTYKAMPASGNENLIASLDLVSEAGDEKTYAVSISQSDNLRGYAVELGINPSHWELVSYEDGLESLRPALSMHKSLGYDELFISATKGFNPIRSKEIEILTLTVKSLTSDPDDISISSAEIVGLDGKMVKAVLAVSAGIPEEFTLSQNYPNPFNPVTTINFALPTPGDVKLAVYNLLGQEVQTLVAGTMQPGVYTATWNSMDNSGRKASSGVYFYRLVVDGKIMSTKKMVMLK